MAESAGATTFESSGSLVLENMKNLFLTGKYADMKVTCQGFTFNVHRAILCSQSTFFDATVNRNFKTVDLPEDDLETIERVLSFLYFNYYDELNHVMDLHTQLISLRLRNLARNMGRIVFEKPGSGLHPPGTIEPYIHIQVYAAANKYGIPTLKDSAAERLDYWFDKVSQGVTPEILTYAFSILPADDSQLRYILINYITKYLGTLVEKEGFSGFLEAYPSIAPAVFVRLKREQKL
ncbi:BTB/POZ domain-containing protein [Aspergillus mulundensis]|uniref:BTB domain-containing protein n=1 Tax=Aspergillus mulundensis TaxID=1810919 RepID=A0A3D8S5G5_9EURO|nr:hypothetical protein DSM5745_05104 [Aspergillus mulundensis]RDW81547.1 hypothetical protein DSM5745_05104 [Aspergillus mulundensis]